MKIVDNNFIKYSFEELCQSFRILMEAHIRATCFDLLREDRSEAIGNIENGLSGVLNSFHNLYDAIQKQIDPPPVNWYESAPLALMLVLRNARHHNHANRIRTLYSHYLQEANEIGNLESYVLVNFPCHEDDATTFDLYMSWGDMKKLFELPRKETQIRNPTRLMILKYLNSSNFPDYARYYRLTESEVFFNIIPLFVNAAATITPFIKMQCDPVSVEAKFFVEHFCTVTKADTINHEVDCGPFALI